tara:strand:+ start:491 stop:931 length:441 start_codon:yes stop_codon:yes gene_type:complete
MSGMHLLPVYWTTNNTKKRKKKVVSKKEQLAILEHEKFLKRMGVKRSVAQPGSASALGAEGRRFESYRSDQNARVAQPAEQLICNHQVEGSIPSSGTIPSYHPSMSKKEEMKYTGDEIIGIAQMHKSNAVPVRGKKAAEELARMRR